MKKTKQIVWAVVGLIVVVGALAGVKAMQIGSMIEAGKSFVPPPESVSTAKVQATQWQPTLSAVGSLVAVQEVVVSAELSGIVRQVAFKSGQAVKKGQLLIRFDTSIEEAELESATAQAKLAQLEFERASGLKDINAASELDTADARAKQTHAQVASLKATLAKKTIHAPFAGRVGVKQVEVGQVVSPGAPIVTLQAFDPIFAEFWVPQQALATIALGQNVRVQSDTFPGQNWNGQISSISPDVDVATRNVRVRATLGNEDGRLRPGMFVNVEVAFAGSTSVIVIPATSVIHAPYGDSVFIVQESKDKSGKTSLVARQKFVRLGERKGDWVSVVSGLEAGQTVVTSGAFKLKNDMAVLVNNELAPNAEMAPKPTDK